MGRAAAPRRITGAPLPGAPGGPRPLDLRLADGARVGLFGGTFDPPHPGHLHAARTAMRRLRLDRVVWLVSPGNPLKPRRGDDLARRVAETRRLARGPGMIVSDAEAALATRYAIDTIRALKLRYPKVRFVWIMGADGLRDLHRWKHWPAIFREIPIAVVARPGAAVRSRLSPAARRFAVARLAPGRAPHLASAAPPAWVYITAPWNAASSTALRLQAGA